MDAKELSLTQKRHEKRIIIEMTYELPRQGTIERHNRARIEVMKSSAFISSGCWCFDNYSLRREKRHIVNL